MVATSLDVGESSFASAGRHKRLLLSCFFGSAIEWYDFGLYALLAPGVFNKLFFPNLSPLFGTLAVLAGFWLGFVGRPLGGLFFGLYGDRIGRKPMMVVTLSLMGISSTLMGLIPTYATIGIAAPLILVVLRLLQGFALGGESTGAPVLAMESAPDGRRGFFASIIQGGAFAGSALASLVSLGVAMLAPDDLLSWGWRVPFLASIVIVSIGLYVRTKVAESPAFLAARKTEKPIKVPLAEVLRRAKKPALIVFFCAVAESSTAYVIGFFGYQYALTVLHLDRTVLLTGTLGGALTGLCFGPVVGMLADRIGRRPIIGAAFVIGALYYAFGFYQLLGSGNNFLVFLAFVMASGLLNPLSLSVEGSFYAELFDDTRLRYTGVSLGRQIGTAVGGLTPTIAQSLLSATGTLISVIAMYAGLCAIALCAILWAHETKDRSLYRRVQ
jgi:MFS family permease